MIDAPLWPPIISAVSGLLGALIGGRASLQAARFAANLSSRRSRAELVERKGEELVTLLCGAVSWFDVISVAIGNPSEVLPPWPTEPDRAEALTHAYFPNLESEISALKGACLAHKEALTNARAVVLKGEQLDWEKTNYAPTYGQILTAASDLRARVLAQMRVHQQL